MVFNGTDWTVVASVGAALLTKIVADAKWLRKKDPKIITQVATLVADRLPHGVGVALDDAGKLVRGLVESPWFASAAATGKVELHHITDKLLQSTLAQEIAKVLAASGKSWTDMSEIEKGTLLTTVQAGMARVGVQVTSAQITAAITPVVDAINAVAPAMQDAADRAAAITQPTTAPAPAKAAK